MAEMVARTGLVRAPGFLYFLRGNAIWRQPMRENVAIAKREPELVWRGDFVVDPAYFYFVGPNGDVMRTPCAVRPSPPQTPTDRSERAARIRRLPLPLSDAVYLRVSSEVPPVLRSLLQLSPARTKLSLRGRWSSVASEELRLLAAFIVDAQPSWLWIAPNPRATKIEFRTSADSIFFLASPISRTEVLAALHAIDAPPDATLVEFYETFGELDDFVLPSPEMTFSTELAPALHAWPPDERRHDAPIVCRAPNGDRLLLERGTGGFTWANRERQRFEPAGSSFAELMRRYLHVLREGRVFDAFSAARQPTLR